MGEADAKANTGSAAANRVEHLMVKDRSRVVGSVLGEGLSLGSGFITARL